MVVHGDDPDEPTKTDGTRTVAARADGHTFRTRKDGSGSATKRAAHPPLPRLEPGARVGGRYRITRAIAEGGYGEVYEAVDERARRTVALKMVAQAARTPWAADALRGEFAVLASLHHPNLADVYEFGWVDDSAFFTQRFVVGTRLDKARLDLGTPRALRLVAQLCRALDYLHARGLLHRDVKPANVIVDLEREHLTLLDFGIASTFGAGDGTSVVGTNGYIPPEAIRGQPLDARSDLYSLGVTLYRLAAGALPFPVAGRTQEDALWDHLMVPPPPLPEHVHAGVAAVIVRLLAKEPTARLASAGEVLDALAAALGEAVARDTPETLASYVLSTSYVEDTGAPLAALERAADRATPSPPSLLLGEAGTGKSRTLRELRHRLQLRGVPWLAVRARRGDATHLLVRDLAEAVLTPDVVLRLADEDRTELARGVPSLRRPRERIAIPVDPERARRLRVEALGRALALRFDARAGVVAVEDVHATDPRAPEQLAEVVRAAAAAGARCAFVVTGRPSPSSDAFARATGADVTGCAPLAPEASRAVVGSTFGDADLLAGTELGAALAGGSHAALWVQESLRLAVEEGRIVRRDGRFRVVDDLPARALEDVLAARLRLLPEGARVVALAAAVWSAPATASELASVSGLRLAGAAAGLRELVRAGVVEAARDAKERTTYAMHDRFAERVPALFAERARRETHLRAALVCGHVRGDPNATARAAAHLLAAGDEARAQGTFLEAARGAEREGRPDLALRFLDRADAAGTASVETELLRYDLARTCGARDVASAALRRLERLARKAAPPERVEVLLRKAREAAATGKSRDGSKHVAKALALAESLGDVGAQARAHLLAGELAVLFSSLEGSLAEYRAAAALSSKLRDRDAEARAWLGVCLAEVQLGRPRDAHVAATSAVRAAAHSDDLALRSDAQRQLGNAVRELGRNAAARDHYRQAVKTARACGCIEREAKALNNLGTTAQFLGDVPSALEAFRRSIALKDRAGATASALLGHNNVGAMQLALGQPEAARVRLAGVVAQLEQGGAIVRYIALSNLADLDAMEGHVGSAVERYREALEFCRARSFRMQESHVLTGLARALLMRDAPGDRTAAETCAADLRALVAGADTAETRRRAHGTAAVLADVRGDADGAVRSARSAVRARDRMTRFSDVFCTALEVQWILALVLAHAGHDAAARREARTARAELDALAAKLPAGDVRASYLGRHPLHRAIREGAIDLPPGWTWRRG